MNFVGWEKLSLVDYDDNLSTTLFMAGCPFRCPFCHNSGLVIDTSQNQEIPWEEIYGYLKQRKSMLDAVCISGGEPTLMPDLEEKIAEIKDLGYIVKLDTNGINPDILKALIDKGLIDYVAMDIKNCEEKYPLTTGLAKVDMEKIKKSISLIMESGIDYEFRTTIIDEYHEEQDMEKIANLIKGAKRYFLQKYIDNGNCIKHGLHEIKYEKACKFISILRKTLKNVSLRGYDKTN